MPIILRPFDAATDLERIVEIENAINDEPVTLEAEARRERERPDWQVRHKTVAVDERGVIVGHGGAVRDAWQAPGRFVVWTMVHPDARGRGAGRLLAADALAFAREMDGTRLVAWVKDDDARSLAFAERQGFDVETHAFESRLDLDAFDETRFAGLEARLEAAGYRFSSIAAEGDTAALRRALYDLNRRTLPDMPGFDGVIPDFEDFDADVFNAEWFDPSGNVLALHEDRIVALGIFGPAPAARTYLNVFTATNAAHRGRGLATAVMLGGIRYARARGGRTLRASNDRRNAAMLHVTRDKFGFEAEPGEYRVVLTTR